MNLHFKYFFAQKAFEIYKKEDDLELIALQIEALMKYYNITFNTENLYSSTTASDQTKTAHDRFVDALDEEEICHAQHMKVVLEEHCNFLNATWIIFNQAA